MKGDPPFTEIYNPGVWISFDFWPEFNYAGGKHKAHKPPTDGVPVPKNEDIEHAVNGCSTLYNYWKQESEDGMVGHPGENR